MDEKQREHCPGGSTALGGALPWEGGHFPGGGALPWKGAPGDTVTPGKELSVF